MAVRAADAEEKRREVAAGLDLVGAGSSRRSAPGRTGFAGAAKRHLQEKNLARFVDERW